jgi:hypothetical protein
MKLYASGINSYNKPNVFNFKTIVCGGNREILNNLGIGAVNPEIAPVEKRGVTYLEDLVSEKGETLFNRALIIPGCPVEVGPRRGAECSIGG